MDQMVKIMEQELQTRGQAVDIGCFAITGDKRTLKQPALFICIDLEESNSSAVWFNYRWGRRWSKTERVNQVTDITYKTSRNVTINFKNGTTGELLTNTVPDWLLSNWKNKIFKPKDSCHIVRDQNKPSYTLTCNTLKDSGSSFEFTQIIKISDFHRPKNRPNIKD